jgi:hypothetical protein
MSEKENNTPSEDENNGPVDETSEEQVSEEKKKLKNMGLDNLSKSGFGFLLEHRKPEEKKSEKKPFTF